MAAVLTLWGCLCSTALAREDTQQLQVVHREPGMFGDVIVADQGEDRFLIFGNIRGDQQTWIKKEQPAGLPMEYLQSAAVALGQQPTRILLIGLGGGAFATFVATRWPQRAVEAVEIDPVVVNVARRFFALPASVTVHVADGAAFLRESRERWDLILVDAYGDDDYPKQLGTQAFFRTLREHLTPDGFMVLNIAAMNRATERQLTRRFIEVTASCYVIPVVSEDADNTVLLGSRRPLSLLKLQRGARRVAGPLRGVPIVDLARRSRPCHRSP